jgi:DDE family transposase
VLLRLVSPLAEDAALGRLDGEEAKVRRYGDFRYAAKSWTVERRVIARVEASLHGADSRFIVTNLPGLPKMLYEKVYGARGQAENRIKAHKLHLASDRTSCRKATANQFRLLIHTAAYWLLLSLRGLTPRTSFWREAQCDTIRLCLIKIAGRVTEVVTRIKVPCRALSLTRPTSPISPAVSPHYRRSQRGRTPQNKPRGATSNPDHQRPRRHRKQRPEGRPRAAQPNPDE